MLNIQLPSDEQIIDQFHIDFNITDGNFNYKSSFVTSATPNRLTVNGFNDGWELRMLTVYSVFDADIDAIQYVIWGSSVDTSTMDITIDDEPFFDQSFDSLEQALRALNYEANAYKIH
ncbi:hypothetical protein CPT_Morttis_033 [Acinetobacter phage Morttis]|nr:hypothetical protein CPT_Maestro_036 [Acinetobacter phage Maestro]QQM18526.1 hypothetical protein CPT_Morttis_033 [Acinetobacter phage Morttis]QQO96736.1 hypothetical protein CPT_Melin_035 [Acinetobacter phage Melin]